MNRIIALIIILISVSLTGCASDLTNRNYSYGAAQQRLIVESGTVTSIRTVKIEGHASRAGGPGMVAGAILGALVGGSNGGGLGGIAVSIIGSAVGGIVGAVTEKKLTEADGLEIAIQLDGSSNMIAITQAIDPKETFIAGDHVRVLTGSNGKSRVIHI